MPVSFAYPELMHVQQAVPLVIKLITQGGGSVDYREAAKACYVIIGYGLAITAGDPPSVDSFGGSYGGENPTLTMAELPTLLEHIVEPKFGAGREDKPAKAIPWALVMQLLMQLLLKQKTTGEVPLDAFASAKPVDRLLPAGGYGRGNYVSEVPAASDRGHGDQVGERNTTNLESAPPKPPAEQAESGK